MEYENDVDLIKTFDLTGNDNDQMLKYYLRKAGLSDNIEYLTSEQRRAFIYDIVKSNKNPGYWKPSVLPQNPTIVRDRFQKTPIERRESSITLADIDDIPPASTTFDINSFRQVKHANFNSNEEQISFQNNEQKANAERQPVTRKLNNSSPSSLPTTTLRTRKGRTIEISGPNNFRHMAGDMTRDMTKNTFDLSGNFNNNSLKKYMIERGITEEDVSCLDSKDLIRRIVQSNFTWMPPETNNMAKTIPPPPSETYVAAEQTPPSPPRNMNLSKGGAIIVSPPLLPAPSSEPLYEEIVQPKRIPCSTRRNRRKPLAPPPPPPVLVKNVQVTASLPPQHLANHDDLPLKLTTNKSVDTISSSSLTPLMPIKGTRRIEKIPPPHSMSIEQTGIPPPPPPPPPMPIAQTLGTGNGLPLPPPPVSLLPPPKPFLSTHRSKPDTPLKPTKTGAEPDRNAFLESIRGGVTLKKVTIQDKQLKNIVGSPNITKQSQENNDPQTTIKQVPVKLDFMSELRNATLKRTKKLDNNPYASESEC